MDLNDAIALPIVQIIIRIIAAIITLLVGRWLAGRARSWLRGVLPKVAVMTPSLTQLTVRASYYGILFLAVLTALMLLGVPVEIVLSVGLLVAIILGIALQQSI